MPASPADNAAHLNPSTALPETVSSGPAPSASAAGERNVDFYVLPGSDARARLRMACRLAEKAYCAYPRVLVWSDDAVELAAFDELLWTFADRSFVPHEPFRGAQQWLEVPVLLSGPSEPAVAAPFDVLLNLGRVVPQLASHAARILEVIDADEARRQAGRDRFRSYREQGLTPQTHRIGAEHTP
jgi:DNA polymerase III subunit chi